MRGWPSYVQLDRCSAKGSLLAFCSLRGAKLFKGYREVYGLTPTLGTTVHPCLQARIPIIKLGEDDSEEHRTIYPLDLNVSTHFEHVCLNFKQYHLALFSSLNLTVPSSRLRIFIIGTF